MKQLHVSKLGLNWFRQSPVPCFAPMPLSEPMLTYPLFHAQREKYNTMKWNLYITVPERKFVTKIRVRYHDPRWRRQQQVRMFTPRFYPGSDD